MKHFCACVLIALFFIFFAGKAKAQVVVTNPSNTTPNLAATYTSLVNAITALNAITAITGQVIITLNPGNPQTAPAGGYAINFTAASTAANNVIITGNDNIITASNALASGSLTDAIFKIAGADYVTIENFTMQENTANTITAANTNNMTEWGVALLCASPSNGAQDNTIQNNRISLNRAYRNTFGIYSNTRHTATVISVTADINNNTTAPNKSNKVYANTISNVNMGIAFIGSGDADYMDTGNDIGGASSSTGNMLTNWGSASAVSNYISNTGSTYGIYINNQKDENVSYNTISSASLGGTPVAVRGIHKDYSTNPTGSFISNITNNTITITHNFASGILDGIRSEQITAPLSTATININNNRFLDISVGTSSSTSIAGITNTSQVGVLNINDNIFRGMTSVATSAGFTAISNSGAVQTALNINNNTIGDALGNAVTFSAATSASLTGISCSAVAPAAAVSISGNNFQGFTQSVTGTGTHMYISLVHAANSATTDNINDNTFTNLVANISNNVTFISRSGAMALSAGATENCNNNKIITAFSKPMAGGTVALYTTASTCLSGNSMLQTGNDFSNITLTGNTVMNGWNNTEGGASGPAKTISNNVFKNWICGTAAVFVVQSNNGGDNTIVSDNDIENISAGAAVTAISHGAGNKAVSQRCSNNTIASISSTGGTVLGIAGGATTILNFDINNNDIHALSSAGATQAEAIKVTAAAKVSLLKNKIYDISAQSAACVVYGIDIATSTNVATYNIVNNIIGGLTAGISNNALAIRGISVSSVAANSTFNIFYNTVYLNAMSSGANFGTAALYLTTSAAASTGAASVRNNIFVNASAPGGTGVTAAYRRSGAQLNNFATSSNNNIFYAGTPSAANLIFYDGTNSDPTLGTYKTRVGPTRDAASYTELPPFLSLSGPSVNFLHIDPSSPTIAESNAVNISGYADDFDAQIRQGNAGYTGTGTSPDIGADELEGTATELDPPVISYVTIASPVCTSAEMILTGVTITDATGIPLTGANRPRIYYRKNAGAWFSNPGSNTGGTATNSTWSFTITAADMGGVTGGDVVAYYVIAQDLVATPNTGSNPATGLAANSVISVTTAPASPNTCTLLYDLSGTYTVGLGGDFTTLTAAVNAYNTACSLSGSIIFELTDNTYPLEAFPITINKHADANSINTLTIRPSATAAPVISGSVAQQIINLNGARYVSLDGRPGGTGTSRSLTVINNNISGIAIQFINDAQNNKLQYCMVKGSCNSGTKGVIFFSTANASGTGNNNNVIDNNDISDGATYPANAICSIGTAGRENDNISITNNNIYNYFKPDGRSVGINLFSNNAAWTITGNRLYQTAARVYTLVSDHYSIWANSGDGYTISNNIIGFANSSGTGTTIMMGNGAAIPGFPAAYSAAEGVDIRYIAIACSFDPGGTVSSIDGNTIGGIAMYTSSPGFPTYGILSGIYVESGNATIGTNAGNTIGSMNGTGSIYAASTAAGATVVAIRTGSNGSVAIRNNNIGAIDVSGTSASISAGITGISTGGSGNFTISNNTIGNADPANLRMGYMVSGSNLSNTGTLKATSGSAAFAGIISATTAGSITITGNTLQGWATSNMVAAVTGIGASASTLLLNPSVTISNNSIGSAPAGWIDYAFPASGQLTGIGINNTSFFSGNYTVDNNDIRGITCTGPASNSGEHDLITISTSNAAGNTVSISGNTFTNLVINTTGNTTFILHSYSVSSSGIQTINNNRIVGTFNRPAISGNLYLLSSSASSASGAQINHTNNDFSNITVTGTTSIRGFQNADGGNPAKIITGNTCANWSAGTGEIRAFDYDHFGGSLSSFSGNTISNLNGQGAITGVLLNNNGNATVLNVSNNNISGLVSTGSGGNVNALSFNTAAAQANINNNLIHGLSSTGANAAINAIVIGGSATAVNLSKNKLYDISGNQAGTIVNGINIIAGNIINLSNNFTGDLRSPVSGMSAPSITGLNIGGGPTVNSYYNTIYLNGISSSSLFSSAAIYASTTATVNLRNTILNNISTPGTAGRTVAYWRSSTNLSTYSAASDNNLFYTGIPSAQRLIYYDGNNSDQDIIAYQARVNPSDDNSISVQPSFISTAGADPNFLHLDASSNCGMLGKGNNAGILIADDYDGDPRSTTTPFLTEIGADEVGKLNVWTGSNGTNWNDAANWSGNYIPDDAGTTVSVSFPPANQPVIGAGQQFQVGSINLGAGATLTNMGTLKVAGTITAATGRINNMAAGVVTGSLELNGACSMAQVLSGNMFAGNNVKDLTITNNVDMDAATGNHLNITGTLSFGAVSGKTFNTGNNIILVSTQTTTANLGDITGNFITGKATVERYINTGLIADGRHLKSWQFLATPTTGQTIFESWQESGNTPSGYGTIITGVGSGFDIVTPNPSMKFYDNGTNMWVGVTNTGNLINDPGGYMVFVRGDRTVTAYNQAAVPTTLRTKGNLYQPAALPPVVSVQPGRLGSVGNPYASAIDLVYMKDNGSFVNLNNDVTVWDPLLAGTYLVGGYQTLSAANNYEPTAGSTSTSYYPAGISSPFIQSGQAFFVRSSGLAGSVTFTEACKESSNRLVSRMHLPLMNRQYFRAALFTPQGVVADGNAVVFDPVFSNSINADDAYKLSNEGENFGLLRQGQSLAVEARKPVDKADTIFYNIINLRKQPYQLRFAPKNMQSTGFSAFLVDKYLQTATALSLADSSFVNIVINDDSRSYAADRFFVIFKKRTSILTYNETGASEQVKRDFPTKTDHAGEAASVSVYPNPVENKTLHVIFVNQPNAAYQLQLINSIGQLMYSGSIEINDTYSTKSIKIDDGIAAGSYLLNIIGKENRTTLKLVIR